MYAAAGSYINKKTDSYNFVFIKCYAHCCESCIWHRNAHWFKNSVSSVHNENVLLKILKINQISVKSYK
jgi:hypothetical protein